jgi:hypothetical protein
MTILWTIPFSTSLIHKSPPATSGACEFSSINTVKKPIQERPSQHYPQSKIVSYPHIIHLAHWVGD